MEKKDNPHAGHRQRKKEQFLRYGLDAFAPHEALELLLYYAIPRMDTNGIAHALLTRFGSLDGVFKASVPELMQVEGVGQSAALLIRLTAQIYKRSQTERDRPGQAIRNEAEAAAFFKKYFWNERNEIVLEVCLDGKCRVLAWHKLSEGGANNSAFNLRDTLRHALEDNAVFVLLAHNHPSGVALPSAEDIQTTETVRYALSAMGVHLLDHIIVAEDDYISLAAAKEQKRKEQEQQQRQQEPEAL